MSTASSCIIAYTGEEERYRPIDRLAISTAQRIGARLIFYDADAASRFGAAGASPLPTWWSGDGQQEQFDNRLDPEQLEKAGRSWLKGRVEAARANGVEAYGWLPSSNSAEALADYAREQHAGLVYVPSELDQSGLAAWLKGEPTLEAIEHELEGPAVAVDLEAAPAR
jgi:hypothetical protein